MIKCTILNSTWMWLQLISIDYKCDNYINKCDDYDYAAVNLSKVIISFFADKTKLNGQSPKRKLQFIFVCICAYLCVCMCVCVCMCTNLLRLFCLFGLSIRQKNWSFRELQQYVKENKLKVKARGAGVNQETLFQSIIAALAKNVGKRKDSTSLTSKSKTDKKETKTNASKKKKITKKKKKASPKKKQKSSKNSKKGPASSKQKPKV